MKNFLIALLSLLVMTQSISTVHAASKDLKKKSERSTIEELRMQREAELLNTEWEVSYAPPLDGKGKAPVNDVLSFADGKISMKGLEPKGFPPVGYTVTAYENSDKGSWETYQQIKEGESSLSMRGDWQGDVMNGVVSTLYEKGKRVETYNFSTQKKLTLKKAEDVGAGAPSPVAASTSSGVLVSKEAASE